jgi:outer membrane immunogenic protein
MRKRFAVGAGVLLGVLVSGGAALAADASPDFSWSGAYIGVQGGYGAATDNATTGMTGVPDAQTDPKGWIAGGQLGFNWEFDNGAVFGIEGAAAATGMKGSTTFHYPDPPTSIGNATVSEQILAYGSIRARFGAGIGMVMPYAIGGFAFASVSRQSQTTAVNKPFTGWTAGAGLELAGGQHWSLRGEYSYYDFGKQNFVIPGPSGGTDVHPTVNVVTGSINYRF